ncbi:MAG TPA: hypothetical protein VFK37_02340 [Bacillales bacterium]|nr:hypothetical protein [Bacillales bacterium]
MDDELRNFLSALKTGQERLSAEITGLREEMYERFQQTHEVMNKRFRQTHEVMSEKFQETRGELKQEIQASEKRVTMKIDHLDDLMAFIEKKSQDNEREIFKLKNK